ncbi:MAG: hypothetical protein ACI9L9_000906 [Marivirga sp.]
MDIKFKKMKMTNNTLYFIVLQLLPIFAFAQRIPIEDNPCPTASISAKFRVELFLTVPDRQSLRQETDALNETVEQITTVTDQQSCSALKDLIINNEKYHQINQSLVGSDKQLYFYQTNKLYYVFWSKKPAFDGIPRTGGKSLFLVIKKDLSQVWEYYL